ncbi:MAG TPA: periplasmic heavy metal sensor [Terriglobia bacterium]|nr:periplasmic heavy metal sensor [Terriglobia bacterium]
MNLNKQLLVVIVFCGLNLPAHAQQRSGGGRGPVGEGAAAQTNPPGETYFLRERLNHYSSLVAPAWWTNTPLVTRLGITPDQKARIERTFENHRPRLESARATLEKEEAQLAQLMNVEPFDRNAALTQAFRVVQARSEMERENTLMAVEMREHLTRAQWAQLPQPSVSLSYAAKELGRRVRTQEATTGGGGRGARGQQ